MNPFDPKTLILAKHAQHVVLIHFPIALFISAVAFDLVAHWTKRDGLREVAYYNLLLAALTTVPVVATGQVSQTFCPLKYAGKRSSGSKPRWECLLKIQLKYVG